MLSSRERRSAGVLLLTAVLLAAGVRLTEEPAVTAVARALRTRPLEHAAAAAGWAAQALSSPRERVTLVRMRCRGRRWR